MSDDSKAEFQLQLPLQCRIDLTVKAGAKTLIELPGRISASARTVEEMQSLIHLEAFLERLTGYRFHLHLITEAPVR